MLFRSHGDKTATIAKSLFEPSAAGRVTRPPVGQGDAEQPGLRIELAKAAYKWWIVEQNDAFAIGIGAAYYKAKVGGTASATVQGTINGVPTSRTVSGNGDQPASRPRSSRRTRTRRSRPASRSSEVLMSLSLLGAAVTMPALTARIEMPSHRGRDRTSCRAVRSGPSTRPSARPSQSQSRA